MSQEINPISYSTQQQQREQEAVKFEQPPKRKGGLNFWTALVLLCLIGTLGWLAFYFGTAKLVTGVFTNFGEGFVTENITNTFISHHQKVSSTQGNMLVVANLESNETFTQAKVLGFRNGYKIPGTRHESSITVPATFQYHVQLDDPWELSTYDHVCVVKAPEVRPTLPVAFDTREVEKENKGWWSSVYGGSNMQELEKSLSEKLGEIAANDEKKEAVREASRESIAEFVKNWLLQEDHWRTDRFRQIKVYFADEKVPDVEELPPTVTLESKSDSFTVDPTLE